jgi:hypothetical protein
VCAGFESVIVETNFCSEIQKPQDGLDILSDLEPVLRAGE